MYCVPSSLDQLDQNVTHFKSAILGSCHQAGVHGVHMILLAIRCPVSDVLTNIRHREILNKEINFFSKH